MIHLVTVLLLPEGIPVAGLMSLARLAGLDLALALDLLVDDSEGLFVPSSPDSLAHDVVS
jgi:hypothetical protein